MKRPKVSVIMPVYNTEAYIDEAIQSVLGQDFDEFELLLINDGSTDGSMTKIEAWAVADHRLQIVSQSNQGLSAARNVGLSLAKGEYVYFMDSDDKIQPNLLSTCIAYCEAHHLDFVYFDAEVFYDTTSEPFLSHAVAYGREMTIPYDVSSGRETLSRQLDKNEFFSSACMFFVRKDFLNMNSLDFEIGLLHEDELFSVLLYLNSQRISYLPQRFFLRRIRAHSIMTSTFTTRNIKAYFTIANRLLEFAKIHADNVTVIDKYLTRMLSAAVWKAYNLPLYERLKLFWICMVKWNKYIKGKILLVLLFKKYRSSQ